MTFGAQWPQTGLSNSGVLRLPSPAPSALRCGFVVSRCMVGGRYIGRQFRPGGVCSSSFARFFHEAAFPRFSTNKALTGSVSFNYSVPLPLYTCIILRTRSAHGRSPLALPSDSNTLLCLSVVPPRVLCCQNPCKMASSDRHRSLCSALKAAKDSLHRHVKLGSFRSQCPWGLSSP